MKNRHEEGLHNKKRPDVEINFSVSLGLYAIVFQAKLAVQEDILNSGNIDTDVGL